MQLINHHKIFLIISLIFKKFLSKYDKTINIKLLLQDEDTEKSIDENFLESFEIIYIILIL